MLSDPVFLLAAVVAVTLVGLAKGGFAGVGTAATPLLALLVPPLQAAAILLPILLVQDVISVWAYRRDWSGWNLKVMMPGAVIGIAVAWLFAAHVSDAVVRVIVGLIGVTYVLNAWFGRGPSANHRPTRVARRLLGRTIGLHIDADPGRQPAVSGVHPAAEAAQR